MGLRKLAVKERILPTQAGADKAKQLLIAERQAKLSDLAALPNQSVSLPPTAQAGEQNVAPKVMAEFLAGKRSGVRTPGGQLVPGRPPNFGRLERRPDVVSPEQLD